MRARLESALGVLPFFAPLRADERVRIAERFRVRRLAAGESWAIAPDAPELVLVLDGQATLTVGGGAPTELFAGDVVGELEVLGHGEGERFTAREPTALATLDRAGLDALFADYPAIAPPWVAALGRELKWRNDLLREISLAHAEGLPAPALEAVLGRRRRN